MELGKSRLSGAVLTSTSQNIFDLDPEWEIDPKQLKIMEKLGRLHPMPIILPFDHAMNAK